MWLVGEAVSPAGVVQWNGRCGRWGACFPAGGFFGVVAGFAEAGGVVRGGRAAGVPGNDVVQVADGRVAVGGAASVVSGLDEAAVPGREEPGPGVHPHELAGAGVGVEPPEPEGERGVIAAPGGAARSRATTGLAVTVSVRDRGPGARPRGTTVSPGTAALAALWTLCAVDEGAGPAGGDGAVAGEPGG